MKTTKRYLRWLPAIGWMALIFLLSSVPSVRLPEAPGIVFVVIHFTEFFILAGLLVWAANGGFRCSPQPAAIMVAFLISAIYAVVDEFHQIFVPGRVPDFFDVAIDTAGAAAACILLSLVLFAAHRSGDDEEGLQQ